jgi:hypothetical protein
MESFYYKERKGIHIGKKRNETIFTNNIIIYVENSKESIKHVLKLMARS